MCSKKLSDEHGAFATRIVVQRALEVASEGVAAMQRFDLITDPHFVSNYCVVYNNLQNQEEHLLVIRRPFFSGLKTYISVLSWNTNDPKKHVSSDVLNPPYEYNSDHKYWTEILGPCNGIYFLEGNPNVLMNPSLGEFKALPESHITSPHGTYTFTDYAGFGFDPKTNDYKVVVLKDLWLKETDERQLGYWSLSCIASIQTLGENLTPLFSLFHLKSGVLLGFSLMQTIVATGGALLKSLVQHKMLF